MRTKFEGAKEASLWAVLAFTVIAPAAGMAAIGLHLDWHPAAVIISSVLAFMAGALAVLLVCFVEAMSP